MRMILSAIISALALVAASSGASAQFSGCYLGVNAGMSATKTETGLDVAPPAFPIATNVLAIDGLGSSGTIAGVHAGCDIKLQQLVVGAWGDYAWHNEAITISSGLLPGTLASLDINSRWTVGGRAGIAFTDSTLVYGLVGWSRMSTGDLTIPPAAMTLAMPTFEGWVFGGGIETVIIPNVRLGVEYRYARYDAQTLALVPGAVLSFQPEMHAVTGRLSYVFAFPGLK